MPPCIWALLGSLGENKYPAICEEAGEVREVEIVIVGGGPAGLGAALEASAAGAEVLLVDEYHTLGGQYYKQAPGAFGIRDPRAEGRQYAEGADLIRRLAASPVEVMLDTLLYGIFDERTLALCRGERTEEIRAKALILAPGAQEMPVAFPGWTLPGVMMGGGAQALVGSQRILPGYRAVMAGVGPLQMKVAAQLAGAGVEVVEVLEASPTSPMSVGHGLRAFGHWGKMREGLEYWLTLKRAGVPIRPRHVPVRALGTEGLEAVVVARLDEDWRVIPGSERTVPADLLCLSYGFLPSTQLPRLAGSRSVFDAEAGSWVTWHDENQETDRKGIYVAGEVGGIGGADVAESEGRLAAIAAARAAGKPHPGGRRPEEQAIRARLAKARRFARVARGMLRVEPALFDLITDDTIVCRCERVTAREVKAAIADGDPTLRGVKGRTRAGMGRCQGRICGHLVSRLIAKQAGVPMAQILPDTPRVPVKPVPLGALAAEAAP
jgi:NADPH-dependent 2,4-dienoyl-CoA reductase/sulfur reductase-like enzyme